MSHAVLIIPKAQKEMGKLPPETYERIKESIQNLGGDPRPPGSSKLTGRDGWRIREGDYRIIYEIDDKAMTVTVLHVGHRRDVYR